MSFFKNDKIEVIEITKEKGQMIFVISLYMSFFKNDKIEVIEITKEKGHFISVIFLPLKGGFFTCHKCSAH